jgi:hypothetical protein
MVPMPKSKNSLFNWVVLLVVAALFGAVVLANYWQYRLEMAELFIKQ